MDGNGKFKSKGKMADCEESQFLGLNTEMSTQASMELNVELKERKFV
jgi:hypothetical protein